MTVAMPTPITTLSGRYRESAAHEAQTPATALSTLARHHVPLRPLATALQQLGRLEANWDSYDALPPSRLAVERAWFLASALVDMGLPPPQIFPTRRGGLQMEWHAPHASLELEFDPNGTTGVFIFDDHRTGLILDGDLPEQQLLLAEALLRILRG